MVFQEGRVIPHLVHTGGEATAEHRAWTERIDAAEKLWGAFGKKKRWMDRHRGATEEDWKKHDAEERERWIEEQRRNEGG